MFSKVIVLFLFTKAVIVLTQQCQNVGNLQVFYDPTCANGKLNSNSKINSIFHLSSFYQNIGGPGCNAGGQNLCRFCG